MSLSPGSKFGPYEIVSHAGSGGMGEVYRARDPKLQRELAIKVLPAALSEDRGFLARFQAEARAASALNHPNIVTIHDIGEVDGRSYILMELVDGRTVRELIEAGRLPIRKILQIAAQTAEGLAAAHARGIVHRDLKPENLMVSRDGVVKILDFGLAKTTAPVTPEDRTVSAGFEGTQPGTVLGTVGYMSPEQASGHSVDFRSDQFSVGTILYEMLTGDRPWRRPTPAESLAAIIREEPPALAAAAPETPTAVRWIVERCLAKDPDDRYASTRDLARDLRSLSEHLSDLTPGGGGAVAPPATRRPLGASSLALAAAALVVGGSLVWFLRPAPDWSPPAPHYLTYSGRDSEPAVSPDGKVLAFVSERNRQKRIYLKQLADGSEAALTAGPDSGPRFSPDGASIFFTHRDNGTDAIYRIPVVGGEPRRVIEDAYNTDVSPDGRDLAFTRRSVDKDGQTEIAVCVASVAGGAERVLHRIRAVALAPPRWSPDGRLLAVPYSMTGALGGIPWKIALVPREGGTIRELAPQGEHGSVSSVVWTKGARQIAYIQIDTGYFTTSGRIMLQDVASGTVRILARALNLGYRLDFAGPGKLVYDAASARGNLRETAMPSGTRAPQTSPGESRWLTRGYSVDRQPFCSWDGTRVVFTSNRDGNMDIWELTLATSAVRRLTDHPEDDWDPYLTRDGQHLLFSSKRSGNYEIWIAGADGTNPRQISHDGVDAENPSTTPDGQWVVYSSHDEKKSGLWRMRIDGSEPRRVLAGTLRAPEVSPDGTFVVFTTIGTEPRFRIARLDDGALAPFSVPLTLNAATAQAEGRIRWMPDGRSLVMSALDAEGLSSIYVQDFDPDRDTSASRRRIIGLDSDYLVDTLGVLPDGKGLVFATTEHPSDLVMLEGIRDLDPPRRTAP